MNTESTAQYIQGNQKTARTCALRRIKKGVRGMNPSKSDHGQRCTHTSITLMQNVERFMNLW
eukprot:NODE_1848_length_827_cov_132.322622_g1457_i0.p2 GENE.NODE_1848_length_827_cov_132.322622_g1457_i0~~NODE_1848_length_827_cov_132.322622_g1457_i0.p2  ORF type:complete len:69 (-),score=15.29 NODE_1848_length_827_cov_132.322622_g1457_i0:620-805(-)